MFTHITTLLAAFALFFFGYLLFGSVFEDIIYRFKVRARANKYGQRLPLIVYDFPFGLRFYRKLRKAQEEHKVPKFIQNSFESLGKRTFRRQVLSRFVFSTTDPENIKAVLATNFKDFSFGLRRPIFFPLLGDGVFTLDGAGWQHTRAMLRPQFSRDQISHLKNMEHHVDKLVDILSKPSADLIDVQSLFFDLTIDTATEFLFGESVCMLSGGNSRIPESYQKFGEAFNRSQNVLSSRMRAQKMYFLVNGKQFREDCKLCKGFANSYVKLALDRTADASEKKSDSYVFLDELAKETRDPVLLCDQALNILVAGRDTTASLLSFVFYELALHPEIYSKLREEILEAFGSGQEITFEALKRCVYMRHVINEALRLYPTVPFNGRTAIRDTTMPRGGGPDESAPIFVPKGSLISYSVFTMHRNPQVWGPDANEFRPERWNRNEEGLHSTTAHPWAFLPFNGGPRICLGQQFALTEASFTIAKLLLAFRGLEGAPTAKTGEPKLQVSLTMSIAGGVPVRFNK